jgi:hypothetical protein
VSAITGTLRVEGRPVGGQDVLAVAGDQVVASTLSDDLGRFSLDAPDGATVLGKVRTGAYGVVTRVAQAGDGGADLDLDGPLAALEIVLESEHELPARLDLTLDPVRLAGVPDELMLYTRMRSPGVMEGHFGRGVIDGARASVRVQPGLWRIAASSIDPDRTHVRSLVTGRGRVGDDEVEGDGAGGVAVDLSRDCRVTLLLRAALQSEL